MSSWARLLVVAVLAWAHAARAGTGDLKVDLPRDLAVTAAAAALSLGAVPMPRLSEHCRICSAGDLDEDARHALRLPTAGANDARRASDALAIVIIPAGALAVSGVAALQEGSPRELLEDVVVVGQAAAIAADVTALSKAFFARPRPGDGAGPASSHSFTSAHASRAFSVAVAAATVSSIRGRRSAPWVWVAGLTLATGVGYLRVASDAHWLTDVAAGAAVGGAVGFGVPWFFHRTTRHGHPLELAPAPGGLALSF